jgi:hypothetical protein
MNSEQLLQQNLPLAMNILESNGIGIGKYSVSASLKRNGESECTISPTSGNSSLFTAKVQDDLTVAGFRVQITT